MRRVSQDMTAKARQLRSAATPAERLLWRDLCRFRPRFTRQLVCGKYIIDFACREAKVAIELDGSQHAQAASYDGRRTTHLENQGWSVIRFWNNEVIENLEGVVEMILIRCAERLGGTHAQPLPSREGRQRRPRSRSMP